MVNVQDVSDFPGTSATSADWPQHAELSLEPLAASVRAARHFVRALLVRAGRTEWVDAAELAISELATNALLHAHSAFQIRADVGPAEVRVEVFDHSPQLPLQRSAGSQATTGRGLDLVAAVTSECGVQLQADGKIVWFTIHDQPAELTEDDLLAQWGVEDAELPVPPPLVTVVLRDLPPTLWLAAREHHSALLRELVLYAAAHFLDVQPEQVALADRGRSWIAAALGEALTQSRRTGQAQRPGPPGHPSPRPDLPLRLDLSVAVPPDAQAAFLAMQGVLDAGEALAAADLLLVRPGLPEIVAVRDWACEQFVAQLSGVEASRWAGAELETFTTPDAGAITHTLPGWDPAPVANSDLSCVAADDGNRIVAVSRSLAATLGWAPQELVGRRVVALIPPGLREAHVAGFSRHLSTGEAHVLGVPLQLPVLRADGTELLCDFLIEEARFRVGRHVYIAWVTPVSD